MRSVLSYNKGTVEKIIIFSLPEITQYDICLYHLCLQFNKLPQIASKINICHLIISHERLNSVKVSIKAEKQMLKRFMSVACRKPAFCFSQK